MRDFIDYVYWNTRYLVSRPDFSYLAKGAQLSFAQLCEKLRNSFYTNKVESGKGKVNYYLTEFSLSSLKIRGNDNLSKFARSRYAQIETRLASATAKLNRSAKLPMFDEITRLEYIAEQITLSTLLGFSAPTAHRLLNVCKDIFKLEAGEIRLFESVLDLYSCKLFCVAVGFIGTNSELAEQIFCNIFRISHNAEHIVFENSQRYSESLAVSRDVTAVVNCYGSSRLSFLGIPLTYPAQNPKNIGLTLTISEKVNIFSTFSRYKFTDKLFVFDCEKAGLTTSLKLFYKGNNEIRRYALHNGYKKGRNLTLTFNLCPYVEGASYEFLQINGSFCVKMIWRGKVFYYCLTLDGLNVQPRFVSNSCSCALLLRAEIPIERYGKKNFTLITSVATHLSQLSSMVTNATALSFGSYPMLFLDKPLPVTNSRNFPQEGKKPTAVSTKSADNSFYNNAKTSKGENLSKVNSFPALSSRAKSRINGVEYSQSLCPPLSPYSDLIKFGGKFSFTVGAKGDNATLWQGYETFGGEKIYLIYGKKALCLTDILPQRKDNFLRYKFSDENITATLDIHFSDKKKFVITCTPLRKTKVTAVFAFNFTRQKSFLYGEKGFTSQDGIFNISCDTACNYTSNISDFDNRAFNVDFSDILTPSDFLCFSCAFTGSVCVTVWAETQPYRFSNVFEGAPPCRNLNFFEQKNAYLLDNFLCPATPFTLAGTVLCNSDFCRSYLLSCLQNGYLDSLTLSFYSQTGKKIYRREIFTFTLACIYFSNYTADKSFFNTSQSGTFIRKQLLAPYGCDLDKMTQMLCLRKSFCLISDNVAFVSRYEQLRVNLTSEQKELGILIGALPDKELSPAMLKQLYEKYADVIDKGWYYLSILENIYGINMQNGLISFSPLPSAEPTSMTLRFGKKQLNLTFKRGKEKVMLNGGEIYSSFSPSNLLKAENKIEIYY